MSKLKQIFLSTLREADEEKTYDPTADEVPLRSRLENDDIEPDALDVEPGPSNTGYKAEVEAAKKWITEIEKFVEYLNDIDQGSINRQINVLDRDNSVFKGIASRISDKIARVSSDLAELKEIMAGFVIASDRKAKNIRLSDSLSVADVVVETLSRIGFETTYSSPKLCRMVLETTEGELKAEVHEDGTVNGESIDAYLDRLASEYDINAIIEDDVLHEEIVMDEKILKQIKEIDDKLAVQWNQDLYAKRKALQSKMETNYIDVAKSLIGEKD